ncbi:SCP-like protein, partial [Ancylostoma caninum]
GGNNIVFTARGTPPVNFGAPEPLIRQALEKWWNPGKQHGLGPGNRYPGQHVYNFASMINSATTEIGCSYKVCGTDRDSERKMEILCLYDDVAYMTNRILYDNGKACTKSEDCTTYRGSKCENGLCVKPKEEPDTGANKMCPLLSGMTDKTRKTILNLHNYFRSLVARGKAEDKTGFTPEGASMLKMKYDCELEKIASKYASKCVYAHSDPNTRTLKGKEAGENLFTVSIPDAEKSKTGDWATRGWFSELKEFGVGKTNLLTESLWNRPGTQIGHYTQVVWGTTSRIGCGVQNCRNQTLVVCNYLEGGNVIDRQKPRQIYEVGPACSKCPSGYSCDKDKLCVKPKSKRV